MAQIEHKKKIAIMIAIMASVLFAALNITIIGTISPAIIADLGGMEYYSWIFSIYMLAASVSAILVGKLSDIYGRKLLLLIGLGIFLVGAFFVGLSSSIVELIILRGIQGLGGGIIMSTAFTAVGDLFPPRQRGRWQGIIAGAFGFASVIGPTLGGYIADNIGWNWAFWVFMPFGIIAFIMISLLFPAKGESTKEPIDYFGSIFITIVIVCLLLALTWGGNEYDWLSIEIIGLFLFSFLALISFVVTEHKVSSPVMPMFMFRNSIFSISNLINFILGFGMFGMVMYLPLFIQGVLGASASVAGFVIIPMTLSMVMTNIMTGHYITKTGKYKAKGLTGLLLMASGMFAMSFMDISTTYFITIIFMTIFGIGLGMAFPIFLLSIQNSLSDKYLGVATATAQLGRQLGGTIGVALMGTIMGYHIQKNMQGISTENHFNYDKIEPHLQEKISTMDDTEVLMNPKEITNLGESLPVEINEIFSQYVDILRESLNQGISSAFLFGACVIIIAFVMTFFLKEIPLRTVQDGSVENIKHDVGNEIKEGM